MEVYFVRTSLRTNESSSGIPFRLERKMKREAFLMRFRSKVYMLPKFVNLPLGKETVSLRILYLLVGNFSGRRMIWRGFPLSQATYYSPLTMIPTLAYSQEEGLCVHPKIDFDA